MEKVVYLLGAGFSAPMGLPVMSNFILKAKDMYFEEPEKYGYFNEIFKTINELSVIKNFFNADLYNIEEILSILEMRSFLVKSDEDADSFRNFIADVINHYTPEIKPYNKTTLYWYDYIFGEASKWSSYGAFVANMLNIKIEKSNVLCCDFFKTSLNYSVVTLNYDLIIEKPICFLGKNYFGNKLQEIVKLLPESSEYFSLAKLHGCAYKGNIVPPTWNKQSNNGLVDTWKLAYKLISEANHIRILGYSLPISDAYIRYFLKAAIIDSKHLKTIDIICRDSSGEVEKKYNDFIDFKFFRFKNDNIMNYLEKLEPKNNINRTIVVNEICFNNLETIHEKFMSN